MDGAVFASSNLPAEVVPPVISITSIRALGHIQPHMGLSSFL